MHRVLFNVIILEGVVAASQLYLTIIFYIQLLGLEIYGYLFTWVGYVISWRVPWVPASPRLAKKSKIFAAKNKIEIKFVEILAYLKARCTKTINKHTLKSNFPEI